MSRRFGLRVQLLISLCVLTLVAVLSTGLLSLLVAKRSYASHEEASALAMARTAAGVLQAARDPGATLEDDARHGRLGAAARSLGSANVLSGVTVFDLRGHPLVASAPGGELERDTGLAAALGGVEHVARSARAKNSVRGSTTELRVYQPLRGPGGVEGVIGLTVPLGTTLSAADARSCWLLLFLGLLDGGVILLAGALLLGRFILRPVTELGRTAERFARGERSLRAREDAAGEIGLLAASFNRMAATLEDKGAEFEARTRELDVSREQLQRADRLASLGRLAAGLAHEIGNPLGAMLGYVEILRRPGQGDDPGLAQDVLDRLYREIERIHRIMQDLLAYSRPPPERVLPVDVGEVVQAALELMRPQPRFREVTLLSEIPGDLPLVTASPGRLTQVLVNLLLNAADAVGGRGEVRVRAHRDAQSVLVEIEDSGPGVPAADRERIFDPFFTTKAPGQGTGLGLSTSLGLCETFGATLTLRNTPPGHGATFVVRLRVAADSISQGTTET
jgi:two-component system, NtrC family, sensor kinase